MACMHVCSIIWSLAELCLLLPTFLLNPTGTRVRAPMRTECMSMCGSAARVVTVERRPHVWRMVYSRMQNNPEPSDRGRDVERGESCHGDWMKSRWRRSPCRPSSMPHQLVCLFACLRTSRVCFSRRCQRLLNRTFCVPCVPCVCQGSYKRVLWTHWVTFLHSHSSGCGGWGGWWRVLTTRRG
jgi:hypothetical protein